MKLVSRGDTTVVDAYLSPLLRRYVDRVAAELGGTRLMFMQSSGGLTDATLFQGKDAILSGPAGGIVGAVETAGQAGFERIISFDMGGTSTDVAHYEGAYERAFETLVAGVRMRAPMMLIHTVAAGGGSICFFDGARYRVGPESAGADPGPASYRRGGPLCVTDCNVMLGKLQPEFFPHVFGPGQDQPLDAGTVREKFAALAGEIREATGDARTPTEVAAGFLKIAVENMANAIKKISVQRGYDVTGYTLNCFGGAGGQHACLVADALGMTTVLIHPFAGVLSAYGMGLADIRALREKAVEAPLEDALMPQLGGLLDDLAAQAEAELRAQDIPAERIEIVRRAHIRYEGSDTPHAIDFGTPDEMSARFEAAHHRHYGFVMPEKRLIVEAAAVEGIGVMAETQEPDRAGRAAPGEIERLAVVQAHMEGRAHETPVFDRDALVPGNRVTGPAIIREQTATTVVEPGWQAALTAKGHLVLDPRRAAGAQLRRRHRLRPGDAGGLQQPLHVHRRADGGDAGEHRLLGEHQGAAGFLLRPLRPRGQPRRQRAAHPDPPRLHGPVGAHGACGESGRAQARRRLCGERPLQRRHPPAGRDRHHAGVRRGGAGDPLLRRQPRPSRRHRRAHAGLDPAGQPQGGRGGHPLRQLQAGGRGHLPRRAKLRAHLAAGRYPARQPDHNVADLKAQIAAGNRGVGEVHRMIEQFGLDVVHAYMRHVQDNAEEQVRRVIDVMADGEFAYPLDEGGEIRVKISFDKAKREATVDFTGTSAQRPTNFNAPSAVCRSAVLYVFRTLVDDNIPLNEGCLKPINIVIPEGSMLAPQYPAAVVAGNTETSQAVTDALFGALGVLAASQGTMNNVIFGNDTHQYYETVCGGSGAGPASTAPRPCTRT